MLCVQDGTHNTGKRVLLKSKWIEGPYVYHSTIYDFTTDLELQQSGSVIGSIANSFIYVFNNELYCLTSGEGVGAKSGLAAKHQYYLWKFEDSTNEWVFVKGPVILALHGDDANYPEYPGISKFEGGPEVTVTGGWGKAHIGQVNFHYIEGSKLWIGYSGKGWRNVIYPQSAYHATVGYIDLEKALK